MGEKLGNSGEKRCKAPHFPGMGSRAIAKDIYRVCRNYTTRLEPHFDEVFGDAGGMELVHGAPLVLGRKLQAQIYRELGLTLRVGLGANPLMAKIASAAANRGEALWIAPEQKDRFLAELPLARLPGVRGEAVRCLHDINIRTVGQLRRLSRAVLVVLFGRHGNELYKHCRGEDTRILCDVDATPPAIARKHVFDRPLCDPAGQQQALKALLQRAMRALRRWRLIASSIQLVIVYHDGKMRCGAKKCLRPAAFDHELVPVALALFSRIHSRRVALRSLKITLSDLFFDQRANDLFEDDLRTKSRNLYRAIDEIRERFGNAALMVGRVA